MTIKNKLASAIFNTFKLKTKIKRRQLIFPISLKNNIMETRYDGQLQKDFIQIPVTKIEKYLSELSESILMGFEFLC